MCDGARRMLAAALQAEVAAYVEQFIGEVDEQGHRLVVRNGYDAEREVITAAGAVPVRQPRVNDRGTHADPQVTDEFDRHAESYPAQRTYGKGNPMTELNAERARRAIVEHTRRLAESAAAAGPDAAVPTTPQWTITDLVEHVGQTQHWTAEIIERRITDPTQLPTDYAVLPTDPRQWQAWLSQSAQRVANACSDDALDAPVFNAAGDERPGTRFWMSNVLNETVVHGFDAANATDRPADIDPDIAAALISHHLAMLTSPTWEMLRSRVRPRHPGHRADPAVAGHRHRGRRGRLVRRTAA